MLSFMREREFEDSSVQKPPSTVGSIPTDSAGDSRRSEPPEGTQEQEYITIAAQDKNVHKSTMMLAVLFGIGLLCLWFMIRKSTPPTAAAAVGAEETQIEIAITRLTGVRSEMFKGIEKIVKKFYEFSDVQQVKVEELVKNPFKVERLLANLKESPDTEKRDSNIDTEAMQLLIITQPGQGDTGWCCMIDDKILYEGDSIKGFNVRQINNSFVRLESEGVEIVLKLSE